MRLRDAHLATTLTLILAAGAVAQPASTSRAPVSIPGTVVDEEGAPVGGVAIRTLGGRATALTTERGQFQIPLPAGPHVVVARRAGFRPDTVQVELAPDDSIALWIVLTRAVVRLGEVVVNDRHVASRLAAFEERRLRSIGGKFISAAEIEAQSPTETSDLLRRVTGLRIADSAHVMVPISNRGYKLVSIGRNLVSVPCIMRIGLNGFIQDSNFTLNDVPPAQIHGIEIYNGPSSIPVEFNAGGVDMYCGLVMIWTKSG